MLALRARHVLAFMRDRWTTIVALAIGICAATATVTALPTFAQGAAADALTRQIDDASGNRPQFAYLFSHEGAASGDIAWSELAEADRWFESAASTAFELPVQHQARLIESARLAASRSDGTALGVRSLVALSDAAERMLLVDGRLPRTPAAGGPIDSLLHIDTATELGVEVGDELQLRPATLQPTAPDDAPLAQVRVVGLWRPNGPSITRWVVRHESLVDRLIVDSGVFTQVENPDATPALQVQNARWYAVLAGDSLTTDRIDDVIDAGQRATATMRSLAPTVERNVAPLDELVQFRAEARRLTRIVLVHAVPLLALIGTHLALVAVLGSEDRRRWATGMRRRGVPASALLVDSAVEAIIVALVAGVVGIVAGRPLASLLARTSGLFQFRGRPFEPRLPQLSYLLALAVIVIAAAAMTAVAAAVIRSAGPSPTRERSPRWRRPAAAAGGAMLLGAVYVVGRSTTDPAATSDAVAEPGTVALPALIALALGLLAVALLVPVLAVLHMFANQFRMTATATSIGAMRATQLVARLPAVVLVATLILATTAVTLGNRLDRDETDAIRHRVGADSTMLEVEVSITRTNDDTGALELARDPLTLDEIAAIDGVRAATRVARFSGVAQRVDGSRSDVTFIGIEPATFAEVAFWRDDFDDRTLISLMQQMIDDPGAMLVAGADASEFRVGEPFGVGAFVRDRVAVVTGSVGARIDHFPSWLPDDDTIIVGRLDALAAATGTASDYAVWLDWTSEPGAGDREPVDRARRRAIDAAGANVLDYNDADRQLADAVARPERRGLLGVLSLTIALATIFAAASFSVWITTDLRRRRSDLAMLASMGMSAREVRVVAGAGLGIVIVAAAGAGVLGGWFVARTVLTRLLGAAPGPALLRLTGVEWRPTMVVVATVLLVVTVVVVATITHRRRDLGPAALAMGEST